MYIKTKKSLGQNFLIDREVLEKIVSITDITNKEVLEIGPGSGNLTTYILKQKPKKLYVVEKDDDLAILLKEKFDTEIEIINDDILKVSEDKIIIPAIKKLRLKNTKINGPFPADTIFTKSLLNKYDVIIGMYHDQVLSPMKALFNFDAINITLGLPFTRISPDHGPNYSMLGKNLSDPKSLTQALKFLDK